LIRSIRSAICWRRHSRSYLSVSGDCCIAAGGLQRDWVYGDIIVGVLGGVAGRYLFAWLGFAPHLASPLPRSRRRSIGERVQDACQLPSASL